MPTLEASGATTIEVFGHLNANNGVKSEQKICDYELDIFKFQLIFDISLRRNNLVYYPGSNLVYPWKCIVQNVAFHKRLYGCFQVERSKIISYFFSFTEIAFTFCPFYPKPIYFLSKTHCYIPFLVQNPNIYTFLSITHRGIPFLSKTRVIPFFVQNP